MVEGPDRYLQLMVMLSVAPDSIQGRVYVQMIKYMKGISLAPLFKLRSLIYQQKQ